MNIRLEYDNYIIWEWVRPLKHHTMYEYWISNSERNIMIYCFGVTERFTEDELRRLADIHYFADEEIEIDEF